MPLELSKSIYKEPYNEVNGCLKELCFMGNL